MVVNHLHNTNMAEITGSCLLYRSPTAISIETTVKKNRIRPYDLPHGRTIITRSIKSSFEIHALLYCCIQPFAICCCPRQLMGCSRQEVDVWTVLKERFFIVDSPGSYSGPSCRWQDTYCIKAIRAELVTRKDVGH
jgi:hypothetical protein